MRAGAAQPGEGIVALTSGGPGHGARRADGADTRRARGTRRPRQHAGRPPIRTARVSLAALGLAGRTTLTALVPPGARDGDVARPRGRAGALLPDDRAGAHRPGDDRTARHRADRHADRHAPSRRPSAADRPADRPTRPIRPDGPDGPDGPELPDRPDRPDRPPVVRPPVPVTDPVVTDAFAAAVATLATRVDAAAPAVTFVGADPVALGGAVLARLAPAASVARRVATMIAAPQPVDPFRGIMAFPILPEATYRYLDELGGGWMLPAADGLEPDTAILLQTNPAFTSAFLVGMNHEMDGELLWRSYPTDQRGTPFQRFWERVDGTVDIEPVHLWPADQPLATAGATARFTTSGGAGADGQIVLLLRGQLLRRYPNMVVYAVRGTHAEARDGGGAGRPAGVRRAPAAGPQPRRVRPDAAAAGQPTSGGSCSSSS